ncbi:hypothetical protein QYS49_33480 [Marivirga salinae]|uniref:Uncharacterized protein n=1 Tax=Marivirga salinarum TaxID=3059078 RepID=A0AA51REY5_9BACT|nr:hypothetical protein [Marivirga sp. BDSF4-3]WMN12405.1 hypothetical protein QYS49_33480 [Marivirga sp. BDSF4-3]
MKTFVILFFSFITFQQSTSTIEGRWKLVSYDVIEMIRLSPGYVNGDDYTRSQIEKQFDLILSKGEYNFEKEQLVYTDLEGDNIKYRNAEYSINADTLFINEIDRDYKRKAFIRFINTDSLVLAPIIEGKVGNSNLIFNREQ